MDALLAHPDLKVDATTPANETALMMAALAGQLEWAQKLMAPRQPDQPRGLDALALRRQAARSRSC